MTNLERWKILRSYPVEHQLESIAEDPSLLEWADNLYSDALEAAARVADSHERWATAEAKEPDAKTIEHGVDGAALLEEQAFAAREIAVEIRKLKEARQ